MKKRIFNLIIIDESGSMQSIKKEAIDSVNETIQTIRGAQRKHETSQTAIYKRCVEAEAEIKRLKTENLLLEAKIRERDREIAEIYTQGAEPYIDYEEQTFDLEIE